MKLLVLDGNSILNRAFFGIKLLSTKDGIFTNGIYGFLAMMQKCKDETHPDAIAIAFDLKAPTFRHKMYDGYKAQRKGMPPELAQQMPILKELLQAFGYHILTAEGYEADDILGTLAAQCELTGNQCVIATGDRDSLQLVSPQVSVRIAATKFGRPEVTLYDMDMIRETYGLSPKQLIDVKALQGDTSDNIPGVTGIGQKGALELIQKFDSIANIYENIDTIEIKDAMRAKLIAGKESAELSYALGKICTEAPVDLNLESYIPKEMDHDAVARILTQLEFFSLMEKMGLSAPAEVVPSSAEFPRELRTLPADQISLPTGTLYFLIQWEDRQPKSITLLTEDAVVTAQGTPAQLSTLLQTIAQAEALDKFTHDCKPVFAHLELCHCEPRGKWSDSMLMGYLLNPSSSDYDLSRLLQEYSAGSGEDLCSTMNALPKLDAILTKKLQENGQEKLLYDIEMPLAQVLASMENIGFSVDAESIQKYGEQLEILVATLQQNIYDHVGYEFNINSPKQLGEALFEKLGLPSAKKTKTGYSTNAEVLEGLRNVHPVVDDILEYRTLAKLKSTYCDGLVKEIAADGRVHSTFNQAETRTGRISSTEPNLQNIPVRTEVGKELRRFFRAKEGWTLVDADYSQIELRVLAAIANDKTMIDAFLQDEAIHTITAAQVFGLPTEMVTPALRSRAKAVNFGIVYGISAFSLSKNIGVTRAEADRYIKNYLDTYGGVRDYLDKVVERAKETGYAETQFGRRRYLPELSSSNFNLRSFGERVAKNMPIQGTAADIIKIAMVRVYQRLRRENLQARLILQVHDELIVEAPQTEAAYVSTLLTEEMEHAISLAVPMLVDCHIGTTWYEAKGE